MLLFSDMNYALVDFLMQEFEQNNSLKIPEDLRKKVRIFMYTSKKVAILFVRVSTGSK